jgi:hypothetical protein
MLWHAIEKAALKKNLSLGLQLYYYYYHNSCRAGSAFCLLEPFSVAFAEPG